MLSDPLLALEAAGAGTPARPVADDAWPGVADADELRGQLLDWLSQYANVGTRRTYAYALGLPIAWVDPAGAPVELAGRSEDRRGDQRGGGPSDRELSEHYRSGSARSESDRRRAGPPPAPPGPLHTLAWFRWCATRGLDPRAATSVHVKAWLHALDAAGAAPRTRQRMLSTLAALYGHLAETGVVGANPAALNRARLGLVTSAREPSPTIRLTAGQVAALLDAAAAAHYSPAAALQPFYATRAVAMVALLTLGLRISEVTGLDVDDRYRTGGEEVLRVLGKGGLRREVYVTGLVRDALSDYQAARDRLTGPAVPSRRGQTRAGATPLLATRDGRRCSRIDLYRLLRRLAAAAGPELADVADRVHPHALRHAYVTIALEHDARIQHVQADVGHATIATTEHYDRGLRTRAASAADLVAEAITTARSPG